MPILSQVGGPPSRVSGFDRPVTGADAEYPGAMRITVPDDCGNSPRNLLVSQLSVDWAAGNLDDVRAWLADDVRWEVLGDPGRDVEGALSLPRDVQEVEVYTAINHGKAASCNGCLVTPTEQIDFCHVFRFSGVAKTARIVHIRTYLVRS